MSDVTRLLEAAGRGDGRAAAGLLPLVYDELRQLAAARMAQERPDHTLSATALVHEAYLRLVPGAARGFAGRGHFFAAAAEAMRRILVENARRRARLRRGGGRARVRLDPELAAAPEAPDDLLAVDDALTVLAREDPAAARVVQLRLFAGLSVEEAGDALGVSRAEAYRQWAYAKAWLRCALAEAGEKSGDDPPADGA